ncbi:MAG: C40 family peptidase [Bacteroidales bacterium]|nr:C40 family peptidase [Bacteroidales bacterium]MDT8374179.1 C40 family peptidase [Bacteroidales bacterium]
MKLSNYLFLLFMLVLLAGCNPKEVPEDLQEQLDSIAAAMVPQHAESLCDVVMVMEKDGSLTVEGETNLPEAKDEILAMLDRSGYNYNDNITVLPDTSLVKSPWGLVSVSVCNVRTRPSHAAEMATQALMGTPVKILTKRGGWLMIQMPDSYIGWTDDPVSELTDDELDEWKKSDRLIYMEHTGVIADNSGQTVSDAVLGMIVQKTGEKGNSYMVKFPDGREGQVKKTEVADFRQWAESVEPDAGKMTEFAGLFLGSPYQWGGTSTKSVDCSGFVKTIYFSAGIILRRDASAQYRYGLERSIENLCDSLAPGDLLFFGRVRDGKKRITHTGMYIGDTEFIHSSRLVRINSFDSTRTNYSQYHLDILQGAKRIIGVAPGEGMERVSQHRWYF